MKKLMFFMLICTISITSCTDPDLPKPKDPDNLTIEPNLVMGYKPIYAKEFRERPVELKGSKPIQAVGKIYYKDGYLFLVKEREGLHIINNSDPTNPVNLEFLEVPGIRDVAIKDNFLYVDSYVDLLIFDLSNPPALPLLSRQNDLLKTKSLEVPNERGVYFECIDEKKGEIIEWEYTNLNNPKCRT